MTQKTYLFTGKKVAFSVGLLASGSEQTGPFDTWTTLIYKKIFTNTENVYDSNTGNLCHSHFFIMLIMMFKYIFKHIQSEFICVSQVFSQHQWMESTSSDFMLTLTLLNKWQSVSIKMIKSSALCLLRSPWPILTAAMVWFSRWWRVIEWAHSCGRTAGFMMMTTATPVSAVFCFFLCERQLNSELWQKMLLFS